MIYQCRFGERCNRSNCRFQHEEKITEEDVNKSMQYYWIPEELPLQTEEKRSNIYHQRKYNENSKADDETIQRKQQWYYMPPLPQNVTLKSSDINQKINREWPQNYGMKNDNVSHPNIDEWNKKFYQKNKTAGIYKESQKNEVSRLNTGHYN